VLLALGIPALAQVPTGSIRGVVKDSSGAIVPSANVTIRNEDTAQTRAIVSGEDGEYLAPALPVGHYDVTATHAGFKTLARQGLTLNVGDNLLVDFTMEVGTTQQEVTVTGEAPLVNTENSTLGGLVNEQQIVDLPLNGRNYMDLSLMQPGITRDVNNGNYQGASTQYSSNGAPVRSNNFTLDGAPVTTLLGRAPTSESGNSMGVDGIKEFKVITSNFTAEYGMAMGSQMAMVSKNGTNQFHGDGFEFFRNSLLDSRNYFDLPPARLNGHRLPEFQKNNFGGSVGGPIKKDKTFFDGVYEGLRQKLGVSPLIVVPADSCHPPNASAANNYGAGTFIWNGLGTQPAGSIGPCKQITGSLSVVGPGNAIGPPGGPLNAVKLNPLIAPLFWAIYPNSANPAIGSPNAGTTGYSYPSSDITHENYAQMRVDQNFSSTDSAFARYTIEDDDLDNNGGNTLPVASSNAYPQYRTTGGGRNQYLSLVENHIFSPVLLNTARLSGSRTYYRIQDVFTENLIGPQFSFAPGFPTGRIQIGGGITNFFPGQNSPAIGTQTIFTFSDDVSYTKGKHGLKFGTLINRFYDGINQTRAESGIIRYLNGGLKTFLTNTVPSNLEESPPGQNQDRHYVWNTFGFYGQDDWRASSRLTLNVGLRYEFMTTVIETNGLQSAFRNPATDGTPTLGPSMRDRTYLNFSPRLGFAYDLTGRGTTSIRGGFGIYYDIGNIGAALQQTALASEPFSEDVVLTNPPAFTSLPLVFPPGGLVPQGLDYNAYQPHLVQYNLTTEHQFPGNLLLSVSYAGSRGVHLFTVQEGNPKIPTVRNGVDTWTGFSPNLNQAIIASGFGGGGSIIDVMTNSESWYNSAQVVVNKRLGHGLQFVSAYTYGKLLDTWQGQGNSSDCTSANAMQSEDPRHPLLDKGPSCFDTTHNWRFNLLYHFPTLRSSGFVSKITNGWWVGSIYSMQSGYAFSPVLGANRSNSGDLQGQSDRPDIVTAASIAANPCTASSPCAYTPVPFNSKTAIDPHPSPTSTGILWFNPNMFELQPTTFDPTAAPVCAQSGGANNVNCYIGRLGNEGRNVLRGPRLSNWDFSLVKDTKVGFLGEAGSVQFRAEFFNLLNHTNFSVPTSGSLQVFGGSTTDTTPFSEAPSAAAGLITATVTNSRQIQLALKLIF
jgi:Carboxypeptidase regulatory-like domain